LAGSGLAGDTECAARMQVQGEPAHRVDRAVFAREIDLQVADTEHRLVLRWSLPGGRVSRCRGVQRSDGHALPPASEEGFSASSSPLLIHSIASSSNNSSVIGINRIHGALSMLLAPSLISTPREVSGGVMPNPTNDSVVSASMAVMTPSTVLMTSTEPRFGIMCRHSTTYHRTPM